REARGLLIELVELIAQGCHVNEPFDEIGIDAHEEAEAVDGGDHAVHLLSEPRLEESDQPELDHRSLGGFGAFLLFGASRRELLDSLRPPLKATPRSQLPREVIDEHLMDDE